MTHTTAHADVQGRTARFSMPGIASADALTAPDGEDVRSLVLSRALWEARRSQSPVHLTTTGDLGTHRILVSPDGTLSPLDDETDVAPFTASLDLAPHASADAATRQAATGEHAPAPEKDPEPPANMTRRQRRSFIVDEPLVGAPAGDSSAALARWGIRIKPSAARARHLANVRATSRHWGGCRTIAVVNGKGGVGKTMSSAMLAAVFARHGGGGVLAWDNNDTRGTLGWRTESDRHDATVQDALAAVPDLLERGAAAADIAWFVHHQSEDRYDVLRSDPTLLAARQRIGRDEFDLLMQVAARYFRLVIFDSGNDESAERWLTMIDASSQLVVPTLAAPESAESAALLLEELAERNDHSARLARNAVVLVTQAENGRRATVARVAGEFAGMVREVKTIPFDPALKDGPLRFEALRRPTQRAWVEAAAAIAAGL